MIPWLILSVIVILTFFFFITRPEKGEREITLKPRRHLEPRTDTEFAEESDLDKQIEMDLSEHTKHDNQNSENKTQREDLRIRNLADPRLTRTEHAGLHSRGMEIETMRLKGNVYDLKIQLKNGDVKKTSEDLSGASKADIEAALDIQPQVKAPLTILEYDPEIAPDHVLRIGNKPTQIPGHEMPIQMILSPMLIALAKDPYWVHLSWVLPEDCPAVNLEIKVKNLSQQAEFYQKVNSDSRSWYIQLNQPDQKFVFELGFWDENGSFRTVLCSNEIKTPTNRPSNIIDSQWMVIDEFYQRKMIISSEGSPEFIMERLGGSEQFVSQYKTD